MQLLIEIPQRIRHVYAHSSLWILFAATHVQENDILLTLLLITTFVASVSHWTWYKHNSIRHHIDRFSASVVILYCFGGNPQAILFATLAVISFVLTHVIILTEPVRMAWHLVFRFWAFSACVARNTPYSIQLHLLHTVFYVIHITILWCSE